MEVSANDALFVAVGSKHVQRRVINHMFTDLIQIDVIGPVIADGCQCIKAATSRYGGHLIQLPTLLTWLMDM